jgi:hypothetical protein
MSFRPAAASVQTAIFLFRAAIKHGLAWRESDRREPAAAEPLDLSVAAVDK